MSLIDWGWFGFIVAPIVKFFLTTIILILGTVGIKSAPKNPKAILTIIVILIIIIIFIWIIL